MANKKFDLGHLVDNFKTMLNPESGVPQADADDALGSKIAALAVLTKELEKSHAAQAKGFAKLNHLLNELFDELQVSPEKTDDAHQDDKGHETQESDKVDDAQQKED